MGLMRPEEPRPILAHGLQPKSQDRRQEFGRLGAMAGDHRLYNAEAWQIGRRRRMQYAPYDRFVNAMAAWLPRRLATSMWHVSCIHHM